MNEEGKKKLHDLMLSEMALVAGKSKSFTSQKLHLLFQSFFFTVVSDYPSALQSFYRLNELLEKNQPFLDNPPQDYLSTLNGIMDSLHMPGNTTEGPYYLDKIMQLDQPLYPEYFRYLVRKKFYMQHVRMLLLSNTPEEAKRLVDAIPPGVFSSYPLADEEKQCELYFYCSLVECSLRNWRAAHLYIREIMQQLKLPAHLLISKAIRLLNIIVYYEKGELLHLEYETRAYKRYFMPSKLLKVEKLFFKIIGSSSVQKRQLLLSAGRRKMATALDDIAKDRYEQQLQKYFNLAGWIQSVAEGRTKKENVVLY